MKGVGGSVGGDEDGSLFGVGAVGGAGAGVGVAAGFELEGEADAAPLEVEDDPLGAVFGEFGVVGGFAGAVGVAEDGEGDVGGAAFDFLELGGELVKEGRVGEDSGGLVGVFGLVHVEEDEGELEGVDTGEFADAGGLLDVHVEGEGSAFGGDDLDMGVFGVAGGVADDGDPPKVAADGVVVMPVSLQIGTDVGEGGEGPLGELLVDFAEHFMEEADGEDGLVAESLEFAGCLDGAGVGDEGGGWAGRSPVSGFGGFLNGLGDGDFGGLVVTFGVGGGEEGLELGGIEGVEVAVDVLVSEHPDFGGSRGGEKTLEDEVIDTAVDALVPTAGDFGGEAEDDGLGFDGFLDEFLEFGDGGGDGDGTGGGFGIGAIASHSRTVVREKSRVKGEAG